MNPTIPRSRKSSETWAHPATHQNILIEVIYFGLSDALDRKNVEILQR